VVNECLYIVASQYSEHRHGSIDYVDNSPKYSQAIFDYVTCIFSRLFVLSVLEV
jgi:hypothetical protein